MTEKLIWDIKAYFLKSTFNSASRLYHELLSEFPACLPTPAPILQLVWWKPGLLSEAPPISLPHTLLTAFGQEMEQSLVQNGKILALYQSLQRSWVLRTCSH